MLWNLISDETSFEKLNISIDRKKKNSLREKDRKSYSRLSKHSAFYIERWHQLQLSRSHTCFASESICLVRCDLMYSHVHTIHFNTRRIALSLFTWRPVRSPSAPIPRNKCPWADLRHTQIGTKQGSGIQWVLATDGPNVNWPGASTVLLDWVLQAIKVKPFSHMAAYISPHCLHNAHFYKNGLHYLRTRPWDWPWIHCIPVQDRLVSHDEWKNDLYWYYTFHKAEHLEDNIVNIYLYKVYFFLVLPYTTYSADCVQINTPII